jgi:hypothetical protein
VAKNEDLSARLQPRLSSAVTVRADAILALLSGKTTRKPTTRRWTSPAGCGTGVAWNQRREDAAMGLGAWPKPSISA